MCDRRRRAPTDPAGPLSERRSQAIVGESPITEPESTDGQGVPVDDPPEEGREPYPGGRAERDEDHGAPRDRDPTYAPLLEPGRRIGHYRIERYIDRGGMGEVYLAENTKLGADVAIKLLPARFSDDDRRLALFAREARMAAQLNHPNIATVHDFFEIDERHYLVMEFVDGRSLRELLKDRKPIAFPKLLDIAVQVAQALVVAHGRNIVHRDLKPENVMVTRDGRVKILDFGLAKVDHTEESSGRRLGESVFSSSVVLGTIGYMSPEQVRGRSVDARSDLFALGVVLYEMATGSSPFRKPTDADTISAILNERQEPLASLNPDVPAAVGELVDKLLAKKPEDRPPSSDAVLAELEAFGAAKRSSLRMTLLLAAVAVVLAVLITVSLLPSRSPEAEAKIDELIDVTVRAERTGGVDQLVQAGGLLRELEAELGADSAALKAPRALLRGAVTAAAEEQHAELVGLLAAGDWESAEHGVEAIGTIASVMDGDDVGRFHRLAEEQLEQARELLRDVEERRDDVDLEADPPRRAWAAITSLGDVSFAGREFGPAAAAALELRPQLLTKLEWKLEDLYAREDPEESDLETFSDLADLLHEVSPTHRDHPRFEARLRELARKKQLRGLVASRAEVVERADARRLWEVRDGEARPVAGELEELYEDMLAIDSDSESEETQQVGRLLGKWRLAATTSDGFARRQSLQTALAGASYTTEEKGSVRDAQGWLERYAEAAKLSDGDPGAAKDVLEELDPSSLAVRFQDAAESLRGELDKRVAAAEARAREEQQRTRAKQLTETAQALVGAIVARARKRRDPTAEQLEQLEQLESEPLLAASELFAAARRSLSELAAERAAGRQRDETYADLRGRLRSADSLDGTAQLLASLRSGWLAEKASLDEAVDYVPEVPLDGLGDVDAELLFRRAEVNLRLRDYASVLEDVQASGRGGTLEGLLLSGMAFFGQRRFAQASSRFEEAELADGGSARAHYWLGTSINRELARDEITDPESIAKALEHLELATRLEGGIADAGYQAAWLRVGQGAIESKPQSFARAIELASEYLESGSELTEDEMIAVFADVQPAAYSERAKQARCGAYRTRAAAHFYLEQYEDCIGNCDDIVEIDEGFAEAYYWRGYARYKLGDSKAAVSDLDAAIGYAANAPELRARARTLRNQISGKRD